MFHLPNQSASFIVHGTDLSHAATQNRSLASENTSTRHPGLVKLSCTSPFNSRRTVSLPSNLSTAQSSASNGHRLTICFVRCVPANRLSISTCRGAFTSLYWGKWVHVRLAFYEDCCSPPSVSGLRISVSPSIRWGSCHPLPKYTRPLFLIDGLMTRYWSAAT